MVKYLITALLSVVFILTLKAQQPMTYPMADSITYECYLKGDWKKLITTGKEAISQNIDYKHLRQRLGYAFFVLKDYYEAQFHYQKALAFDEYDPDTNEYLYYCSLNTGDEAQARWLAAKLPENLRKKLKTKAVKPLEAVDFEYNYKSNNSDARSNPTYLRTGLNTQLGYRVTLYQSVSNYRQIVDAALTKQPEYFALLSWSLTSRITADAAYHYLNTSVDGYRIPGHMAFAALSTRINRFSLGANGSLLSTTSGNTAQIGVQAGVALPGSSGFYLKSSLCEMVETGNNRTIFSQVAGVRLTGKVWAEGKITFGNLKNYNDFKALYVYNSADQATFRTGSTLLWYACNKASLFVNYTFDKKEITTTLDNYNQQSLSAGIIWKL